MIFKSNGLISRDKVFLEQKNWKIELIEQIQTRKNYYRTNDSIVSKLQEKTNYEIPIINGEWIREKGGYYKLIIECPFCGMFHKHCAEEAVLFYNLKNNLETDIIRLSHCGQEGNGKIIEEYKQLKSWLCYRIKANTGIIKNVNKKFIIESMNERRKKLNYD